MLWFGFQALPLHYGDVAGVSVIVPVGAGVSVDVDVGVNVGGATVNVEVGGNVFVGGRGVFVGAATTMETVSVEPNCVPVCVESCHDPV